MGGLDMGQTAQHHVRAGCFGRDRPSGQQPFVGDGHAGRRRLLRGCAVGWRVACRVRGRHQFPLPGGGWH